MTEFWKTIPHSMFDFVHYYNDIAAMLPDSCIIAEIGVGDGASAIFLAERLADMGKNFQFKLIDNLDYGKAKQFKTIMDNVYGSGLAKFIEVIPIDSLNASLDFPDNFFDFVFIDSGHTYELTKAEIRLWYHKVKYGGTLAGHDYSNIEWQGIRNAVDEVIKDEKAYVIDTAEGYGVWGVKKSFLIELA